jgi:transcription termination factor Rho
MYNIETLRSKSDLEVATLLKGLGLKVAKNATENDKIFAILDHQASNPKIVVDYFNTHETPIVPAEKPKARKPRITPKEKVESPAPSKNSTKIISENKEIPTQNTENLPEIKTETVFYKSHIPTIHFGWVEQREIFFSFFG